MEEIEKNVSAENASLTERLSEAVRALRSIKPGEIDSLVVTLLCRFEEAEETLRAIRAGEIDALVIQGVRGEEVLTLQGADTSYRTIFETMNEAVAVVARGGVILHCNARLGALLKVPLVKLIGTSITAFVQPADLEAFERLLLEGGGGIARGELALRCVDGSVVPVQLALNALTHCGAPAVCVVAAEITELKRTEERLQESEERFRLVIEDVRDYAIITLDENGYVAGWNVGAERVKGYCAGEILGQHFSCFYPPEAVQAGKPAKALEIAREQGRFEEEAWRIRKDGTLFWAHVSVTALRNKAGRLIGFSKVVRDESQQKQAEEAVRQSAELFHSAAEYFPGGFVIYDAQKRFQFVNRNTMEMLKMERGQILGRTNEEVFGPEVTSQYLPALERCAQEKATQTLEVSITLPGGSYVRLLSFVPILGGNGELRQILGIGYDITERRRAEEQVEEALKKEVILRREIQHRVKNSIQIISSLLFLQSQELSDPKTLEVLRECQSRARSIALVYGMLSQRSEIARIEFSPYAQQLIGALASAYEIRRSAISFDISAEKILLDIDTAVPCGLIITELVSNALKYAFPECRQGEIKVALERHGEGQLLLTVSDNGIGLPGGFDLEDQRSLGLRLVRDLALQMGGKVDYQSDRGVTFKVLFPAPPK